MSSRRSKPEACCRATLFGAVTVVPKKTFGSPTSRARLSHAAASRYQPPDISCEIAASRAVCRSGGMFAAASLLVYERGELSGFGR